MHAFSKRHGVGIHYMLYNPSVIPWQIQTPVEQAPQILENKVGIRVIPKRLVDNMTRKETGYSPSYADIAKVFAKESAETPIRQAGASKASSATTSSPVTKDWSTTPQTSKP